MRSQIGNTQGYAGPGNIEDGEENEQGLFSLFRSISAGSLENTRYQRDPGQKQDNSGIRASYSWSRAVLKKKGNFFLSPFQWDATPGRGRKAALQSSTKPAWQARISRSQQPFLLDFLLTGILSLVCLTGVPFSAKGIPIFFRS